VLKILITSQLYLHTVGVLRAAGCVFAEAEAKLLISEASNPKELDLLVNRRISGMPLEHILGWAEFRGQRYVVGPGSFIPRSELMVDLAISLAHPKAIILDVCCGTGALGVSTAMEIPGSSLYACDIDEGELIYARVNVRQVKGYVYAGDLFDALPSNLQGSVNVLLANVPYVPTDKIRLMPSEARDYEPKVSLDGGDDGLDIFRRVVGQAAQWLKVGGHLFLETARDQKDAALEIVRMCGLDARSVSSSEVQATIIIGTRSA
jgi:release factor glutamine methyltransferase